MVSLILILQKRASTIIYTQVIEDRKLTVCTNYRAETKLLCNCCWMRHDLFLLIMLKFVFFLQSMLERDQFIYNNLYKGYMFVTSLCIHIVLQASFELRFICAMYKPSNSQNLFRCNFGGSQWRVGRMVMPMDCSMRCRFEPAGLWATLLEIQGHVHFINSSKSKVIYGSKYGY